MKIIITADIHNGVPKRMNDCIWSMRTIRDYAHKNDISVILILGDLFHDRFSIDIDVLTQVYDFFDETDKDYEQKWMCFPGNHDMFLKNSWRVNSLRPLARLLDIYEDVSLIKIDGHRFWILPFIHFESAYMNVLAKVEEQHEEGDVLLTHIGVNGASLNECFLLKNWNIVTFTDSPFDRIYTGHFHCTQQVGHNLWYPGSLIPFRFDEGVVDHGFFVYDMESREHEFVKTYEVGPSESRPPDYLTVPCDDINPDHLPGNKIRVILDREYTGNELDEIRSGLIEQGAVSVNWLKPKEKELDIRKAQLEGANISSIDNIFVAWLEHDQPKDMNNELLIKLNDQIVQESKEKIVLEEVEDV